MSETPRVRAYCDAVGIEFMESALSWDKGERKEVAWYGEGTGPWHGPLRDSTGISAPTTEYPPLEDDPRLVELYERRRFTTRTSRWSPFEWKRWISSSVPSKYMSRSTARFPPSMRQLSRCILG